MRTATKETSVFTYPELPEEAKETVRERYSQFLWEDGEMQERCQDIADGILEDAGFEEAKDLTYALYVQNNGVHFSTRTKQPILLDNGGKRRTRHTVIVTSRACGASTYTFDIEVLDKDGYEVAEPTTTLAQSAAELIDNLSREMDAAFYKEDEYMSSDEVVAESAEANGWEYTATGQLY